MSVCAAGGSRGRQGTHKGACGKDWKSSKTGRAKPRLSGCGSDELLYHSNDDGASDVHGYPREIAAGKMQNHVM